MTNYTSFLLAPHTPLRLLLQVHYSLHCFFFLSLFFSLNRLSLLSSSVIPSLYWDFLFYFLYISLSLFVSSSCLSSLPFLLPPPLSPHDPGPPSCVTGVEGVLRGRRCTILGLHLCCQRFWPNYMGWKRYSMVSDEEKWTAIMLIYDR